MRHRLSAAVFLAATMGVAGSGSAQIAHVPSGYPTIQGAISSGATTVFVDEGTYHEVLAISNSVSLLPEPPADGLHPVPFPVVDGMALTLNSNTSVVVQGFHFTGPVTQTDAILAGTRSSSIEQCRLDRGFTSNTGISLDRRIRLRGCLIFGDAYVYAYWNDVTENTVVGGQLTVHSNGAIGAIVRDNLVLGPAPIGISMPSSDVGGTATGNIVRGTVLGMLAKGGAVSGNTVQDCSGNGYATAASGGATTTAFSNNVAQRCGGHGFDIPGIPAATLVSNVADAAGLAGIHVGTGSDVPTIKGNFVRSSGSHGIWVEGVSSIVASNTVLLAHGDGIRATSRPEFNVVGRCTGNGNVAPEARNNTTYLNALSGFVLNGSSPVTISNNIAHGNAAHGLVWTGSGTPVVDCNDWFGNIAGATSGVSPGPHDIALNPLFCNLSADKVTLSSVSPCLAPAGCTTMGALGEGCLTPTGVAPPADPAGASWTAHPNPALGVIEFSWRASGEPQQLELFDVGGARRFHRALAPGATTFRWSGRDDEGRLLPDGVYFARRTSARARESLRIVLHH